MAEIYHTALMHKAYKQDAEHNVINGIYEGNGIEVFQHDICKGVHPEFLRCDAIHSEIAWRAGYGAFTEGTIADGSSFKDYIQGMVNCIRALNVPAFIICGKSLLPMLQPDHTYDTHYKYHNCDAKYAVYNYDPIPWFLTQDEYAARDYITKNYHNVLDFCCGYGILAEAAQKNGCNAVLSDINTDCVKYVAEHYCGKDVAYASREA